MFARILQEVLNDSSYIRFQKTWPVTKANGADAELLHEGLNILDFEVFVPVKFGFLGFKGVLVGGIISV